MGRYDWLRAYDGTSSTAPPIGQKLCGNSTPPNIISTSNEIHVKFSTDSSVNKTGFRILYNETVTVTPLNDVTGCNGTYDAIKQEITSPNYPQSYGNSMNCSWTIKVSPGKKVELKFLDFNLETATNCRYDWLRAYDGTSSNAPPIGQKLCGNSTPPNIISTRNEIHVKFSTDHSVNNTGFRILYNETVTVTPLNDVTGCNGTYDAIKQEITSPNY